MDFSNTVVLDLIYKDEITLELKKKPESLSDEEAKEIIHTRIMNMDESLGFGLVFDIEEDQGEMKLAPHKMMGLFSRIWS